VTIQLSEKESLFTKFSNFPTSLHLKQNKKIQKQNLKKLLKFGHYESNHDEISNDVKNPKQKWKFDYSKIEFSSSIVTGVVWKIKFPCVHFWIF